MGSGPSIFAGHTFEVCNYRIDNGNDKVHHQVYDNSDSSYAIYNMNYLNRNQGTCIDDLWCTTNNSCDVRICLGDCDSSSNYQTMLNNMSKKYVYVFDEDNIIETDVSGFTKHTFEIENASTVDLTVKIGTNEPYANTYKGIAEEETWTSAINGETTQTFTLTSGGTRSVECYSLVDDFCSIQIYDYGETDIDLWLDSFDATSDSTYVYQE